MRVGLIYNTDTSKFAAGSVLCQIQNGKPRLIAYASKRLPEAVRSYSITELELCGLVINIASFSHLLQRVDFDAIVDHLALTHTIKSKAEPAMTRIKRLLELISSYSFNLYGMKGKNMVLSDFYLDRIMMIVIPHEIIPILFNMYNALYESYYRIEPQDRYQVQMQSQTKVIGAMLPKVHGTKTTLDMSSLPEKRPQIHAKQVVKNRPKLGRGRAGIRCKKPQLVADITLDTDKSRKIPTAQNVTKNNMYFPVPNQLLTNKTETITRGKNTR